MPKAAHSPTDPRLPDYDTIRALLDYKPETGEFFWKITRGRAKAGALAGTRSKAHGYWIIGFGGLIFRRNRLAFFWMTGKWLPADVVVDHQNRDHTDDAWENLVPKTPLGNVQNLSSHRGSTSRFVGVSWDTRSRKWKASIGHDRKVIHLGYHPCEAKAAIAYMQAKARYHTERPFVLQAGV